MSVGFKTQHIGALLTQFQDFGDGRVRIIGVFVVTTRHKCAPDFFAQVAARRIFQKGLHGRTGVCKRPSGFSLGLCCRLQRGNKTVRQPRNIRRVGQQDIGFLICQHLVLEFGKFGGKRRLYPDNFRLLRRIQLCAIAHQSVIGAL